MGFFQAILQCLTGEASRDNVKYDNKNYHEFKDDKAVRTAQDIASEFIDTLYSAEKKGRDLEQKLNDIVTEYGWTENIGVAILNGLENALKKGAAMAPVMKEAFDKAITAAVDFAKEHPIYCIIIALGILILISPWILEAIGFGELGPIEGTWAARWQASLGDVEKGHLFTYFQRLGMKWRIVL